MSRADERALPSKLRRWRVMFYIAAFGLTNALRYPLQIGLLWGLVIFGGVALSLGVVEYLISGTLPPDDPFPDRQNLTR